VLTKASLLAQSHSIDSLKTEIRKSKKDTGVCKMLYKMVEFEKNDTMQFTYAQELIAYCESKLKEVTTSNPERIVYKKNLAEVYNKMGFKAEGKHDFQRALTYYSKSVKISEEIKDKMAESDFMLNFAGAYNRLNDFTNAIAFYIKSLKIKEEIKDTIGIASALNNLGSIYNNQGNIPKAIDYYSKSLNFFEALNNNEGASACLNNIGLIYQNQSEHTNALEYFNKSLKLREKSFDKKGVAQCYNNISLVYVALKDIPKAIEYGEKALTLREELGDKKAIANSLNNIGVIYFNNGEKPKALNYYQKALKLREEIDYKPGIANSMLNIGNVYFTLKKHDLSIKYNNGALQISKELGFPNIIRDAAQRLSLVYKVTGNYKFALENYELYIQMRDSLNNESTRKASIRSQLKYEYEKQAAADSVAHAKESEIKNVQLQKQTAEIKAKKNQQYALFGGLGLVIIFAGFMFNRFKVTQKQKYIIEEQKTVVEEQKKLVEEKQKEVMDSIRYAKRIQTALLPNERYIEKSLAKLTNHEGK